MMKNSKILTRRIQLLINSSDKILRNEYYSKLFLWQNIVFRGANMIIAHQYMQENIKDLIYLQDDVILKLADRSKEPNGILNTSRLNTTYKVLSLHFKGQIPTDIISNLNVNLIKKFTAERSDYWKGIKTIKNHKRTMPIPFSGKRLKLIESENQRDFNFTLFKIPFKTYLGKDQSDKRLLLKKAMNNELKICSSYLQMVNGKIFLLLALEMPIIKVDLKPYLIAEASLSIEYPITVKIGNKQYQIGTKEDFFYRRLAIQSSYNRLRKIATYNNGGHGKKKKLKCVTRLSTNEKNYVESKLHLYSRKLIDICIHAKSGTILLVNQTQNQELAKENVFN